MAVHRLLGSALAALCVLVCAMRAHAEPAAAPDRTDEARVLFHEAQSLLDAGQVARACDTFEHSLGVKDGIGTLFNLADCKERLGLTATALRLFREVEQRATSSSQVERAQLAHERVTELETRRSQLLIVVRGEAEAVIDVRCDGEPVPASELGKPRTVDPGRRRITVGRAGQTLEVLEVDVPVGPAVVPVLLGESAEQPASPPTIGLPVEPGTAARDLGVAPERSDSRSEVITALLGAGSLGSVAAGTLAWQAVTTRSQARRTCPTVEGCLGDSRLEHDALNERAKSATTEAWIAGSVALSSIVAAGILWLIGSDAAERAAEPVQLTATATPGLVTCVVGGSF
jgi:hypothetical protein